MGMICPYSPSHRARSRGSSRWAGQGGPFPRGVPVPRGSSRCPGPRLAGTRCARGPVTPSAPGFPSPALSGPGMWGATPRPPRSPQGRGDVGRSNFVPAGSSPPHCPYHRGPGPERWDPWFGVLGGTAAPEHGQRGTAGGFSTRAGPEGLSCTRTCSGSPPGPLGGPSGPRAPSSGTVAPWGGRAPPRCPGPDVTRRSQAARPPVSPGTARGWSPELARCSPSASPAASWPRVSGRGGGEGR